MKKILHVIIACFYKEGFGYQENILPEKHKELGYDVYVVFNGGKEKTTHYINDSGIKVCALQSNKNILHHIPYIKSFIPSTIGLYNHICCVNPDIIFIHGSESIDNLEVCKYKKKNPNVKVFSDQHGDYYNTPVNTFKRKFVAKTVYRYIAKNIEKAAEKMWGVTPWRVHYLQNIYNISPEKTGLLVMGGDERLIDWDNRINIRKGIREKYNIPDDAFLIITGGKIDKAKNIHLLIEAFNKIDRSDTHLVIFGNYNEEMEKVCKSMFNKRITDIGWLNSKDVYPFFIASDLAVFPGTHSVLWEQACAAGLPAIFKDWNGGMNHVDVGGNCIILKEDVTIDSLMQIIKKILTDRNFYISMQNKAQTTGREIFSYIEIAKRAIEY